MSMSRTPIAYGTPIAKLQSDIAFANGEAQFNNFSATQDGATIVGTAAYGLSSKTYRLNLNGTNFDLSRVEKLQKERFTVAGRLDFTASGTGNVDVPSLNAGHPSSRGHAQRRARWRL